METLIILPDKYIIIIIMLPNGYSSLKVCLGLVMILKDGVGNFSSSAYSN